MPSPPADVAASGSRQEAAATPATVLSGRGAGADSAIEILRISATFLLVSYHVLNGPEMREIVGAGHPLRLASDFLVDLRMPLFAFIAGYVYAIRPIGSGPFPAFVAGKARRLLVPGAVAAAVFAATATLLGLRFAVPLDESWRIFVFPYVHYWFLQSIFLVLLIVAVAQKILGQRAVPLLFAVASAALIAGVKVPTQVFSAQGAGYLLPYFTLGALALRHRGTIERSRLTVLVVGLPVLLGAATWSIASYAGTGAFSDGRFDLQSWLFAVNACLLLMLLPVRSRHLAAFGAFSFTIYLYHVFGTGGAREALLALEVGNLWLHYGAGVVAGFAVPVALHLVARRHVLSRRLVLGLR